MSMSLDGGILSTVNTLPDYMHAAQERHYAYPAEPRPFRDK